MGGKKKYSLVMSHALVYFSLSPRLAGDLGYVVGVRAWVYLLIHVIRVSYVRAMIIITIILVIMFAAPPILVSAWLMAVLLAYRIEYYYYYYIVLLLLLSCMHG